MNIGIVGVLNIVHFLIYFVQNVNQRHSMHACAYIRTVTLYNNDSNCKCFVVILVVFSMEHIIVSIIHKSNVLFAQLAITTVL